MIVTEEWHHPVPGSIKRLQRRDVDMKQIYAFDVADNAS